jgi:hypothetical protein
VLSSVPPVWAVLPAPFVAIPLFVLPSVPFLALLAVLADDLGHAFERDQAA